MSSPPSSERRGERGPGEQAWVTANSHMEPNNQRFLTDMWSATMWEGVPLQAYPIMLLHIQGLWWLPKKHQIQQAWSGQWCSEVKYNHANSNTKINTNTNTEFKISSINTMTKNCSWLIKQLQGNRNFFLKKSSDDWYYNQSTNTPNQKLNQKSYDFSFSFSFQKHVCFANSKTNQAHSFSSSSTTKRTSENGSRLTSLERPLGR